MEHAERLSLHGAFQAIRRRWHLTLGVLSIVGVGLVSMAVSRHQNLCYDGVPYLYAAMVKAAYNPPAVYLETPPLLFLYLRFFVDYQEFELPYQEQDFQLVNGALPKNLYSADRLVDFQLHNEEVLPAQVVKAKCGMALFSCLGFGFLLLVLHRHSGDRVLVLLVFLLFVTQPMIISLMNLVMADMLIVTVYLMAVWLLEKLLHLDGDGMKSWRVGLSLVTVSSLLLLTKFTCVGLYLGIMLAVMLRRSRLRQRVALFALFVVVPVLLINLAYGFSWIQYPHTEVASRAASMLTDKPFAGLVSALCAVLPLPDAYLAGLVEFLHHLGTGHKAYLLGESFCDGRWYFFPVSLLLKLTVFASVVVGASIVCLLGRLASRGVRAFKSVEIAVLTPPLLLFLLALGSKVNDGVRHVVWVVPFLFLTITVAYRGWSRRLRQVFLCLLCAGVAYNLVALGVYFPAYVPFVDPVFGGPDRAGEYVGGSSIDVGEHLWAAEEYLWRQPGVKRVVSFYGGTAIPRDLHRLEWIPGSDEVVYDSSTRVLLSESLRAYDRRRYDALIEGFEVEQVIGDNIFILRPPHRDLMGLHGARIFRVGTDR